MPRPDESCAPGPHPVPDGDSTASETLPVARAASEDAVQSSLELRVRYVDRPREVVPLHRATVEHVIDGVHLRFHPEPGRARFRCLTSSAQVYKNGEAVDAGTLEAGASIEVGRHRVFLWDAGNPIAYLRGYSTPCANEIWPLPPGLHPIGRAGRRQNAVQLDHPTVSREHATITADADGRYTVTGESTTNPVFVHGERVEPGTSRPLQHGDLLEVGTLVFRFHRPEQTPSSTEDGATSLEVRSFGGLSVRIADRTLSDKIWKTQNVKWMFAHLAYTWDKPLGVEILLEELWPDADLKGARNNFNYSLSTLRKMLREEMPPSLQATEIVLRTSSTMQLNPDLLDHHDAIALRRISATRPPCDAQSESEWDRAAEAAILSYAGPFLPECYLDWAEAARQTLEIAVMDLARILLERLDERHAWDQAVTVGSHVLGLDRCAQWACLHVMRALSHTGRALEALRLFDASRAHWMQTVGVEPEMALLREQQRILTLL